MTDKASAVLIKRYGGKRLYDVGQARYVTADDLLEWQAVSVPFVVRDARSGADVTARVASPYKTEVMSARIRAAGRISICDLARMRSTN